MHVYRWDLDKTYLDTDIDSVRGLIRAAVEPATRKRNVPGSAALLRALVRADPEARVCILSGSPEQMRPVLEEKLTLDGVAFHQLILKDNLGNLRRGRLSAVRGQVGYKLPHLLEQRIGLGHAVQETLFGDDSEADAAIYAIYADAIAGRVDADEVARLLDASRAYRDHMRRALEALERVGTADAVEDVFIRMQPKVPLKVFELLGDRVTPVFSWFQAAAILHQRGRLDAEALAAVGLACSTEPHDWAAWLLDLVRRGRLTADEALSTIEASPPLGPSRPLLERGIARMGGLRAENRRGPPDYLGFLRAVGSR